MTDLSTQLEGDAPLNKQFCDSALGSVGGVLSTTNNIFTARKIVTQLRDERIQLCSPLQITYKVTDSIFTSCFSNL